MNIKKLNSTGWGALIGGFIGLFGGLAFFNGITSVEIAERQGLSRVCPWSVP